MPASRIYTGGRQHRHVLVEPLDADVGEDWGFAYRLAAEIVEAAIAPPRDLRVEASGQALRDGGLQKAGGPLVRVQCHSDQAALTVKARVEDLVVRLGGG